MSARQAIRKRQAMPIEFLTGDMRRIAEIAGVDAALRISEELSGCYVYIPVLNALMRRSRNEFIRAEYDSGVTVRTLAVKYKISERAIRKVLGSLD